MKHLFLGILVAFSTLSFTPAGRVAHNPIGEHADYMLDKSSGRTSSLIASGSGAGFIDEFLPDYEHGPSYPVNITYDLMVRLQGPVKGSLVIPMPEAYFTPEFMVALRATGHFETPDFKMIYEGTADARTLDGGVYPKCDKVLLYDIKAVEESDLPVLIAAAAGFTKEQIASGLVSIEDVRIRALVHPRIPVVGGAKLDVTGKANGISVKIGLDYKRVL